MQKLEQDHLSKITDENLILTNRKTLQLEGITEVIATSESNLYLKLKNTNLQITGSNITITKLDVEKGILEANGNFDTIKYGKTGGFLRKIFK